MKNYLYFSVREHFFPPMLRFRDLAGKDNSRLRGQWYDVLVAALPVLISSVISASIFQKFDLPMFSPWLSLAVFFTFPFLLGIILGGPESSGFDDGVDQLLRFVVLLLISAVFGITIVGITVLMVPAAFLVLFPISRLVVKIFIIPTVKMFTLGSSYDEFLEDNRYKLENLKKDKTYETIRLF